MIGDLSRREMLVRSGVCLGASAVAGAAAAGAESGAAPGKPPFRYSLNTSTISGHKLSLAEQVEVAAKAGYQGIEPWLRDIQRYQDEGGSLAELGKRIADLGLEVENAIGFTRWAVDDEAERQAGLEQYRREMEMVAALGGTRIAAPPSGINKTAGVSLVAIAQRYRALLELRRRMGVAPQLEIWGSALTLGRASEAAFVAVAADHPDACVLLDAYQLYKGGSGFDGILAISGRAMHVFHMNDYPANPPREKVADADRVYPGDGVCPLDRVLRNLHAVGFHGALSLELFNRTYWQAQDALSVARTGLEKMRAVVEKAMAESGA